MTLTVIRGNTLQIELMPAGKRELFHLLAEHGLELPVTPTELWCVMENMDMLQVWNVEVYELCQQLTTLRHDKIQTVEIV